MGALSKTFGSAKNGSETRIGAMGRTVSLKNSAHTRRSIDLQGGRYCQAINWILVERVSVRASTARRLLCSRSLTPYFSHILQPKTASCEAQTEIDASSSESIGFVSFHYPGVKSPAGKEIGYGDWSCRSRWLFDGNWCQTRSPVNTGPWFTADAPYAVSMGQFAGGKFKISDMPSNIRLYMKVLWNQANASGTFTFTQDQDLHAGPYEHEWQGATVSL